MHSSHHPVVDAWRAAAADLGIRVTVPFTLTDRHGVAIEFTALVHNFGTRGGTLVWTMPDALDAMRLPTGVPYFVSMLNAAVYGEYDRTRFVATLEAWGWTGAGSPPPWYRGE